MTKNVDMNVEVAEQPPPTAPAASRGKYVNWIDLYDAKAFRWHQFWLAREWGPVDSVRAFGAVRWVVGDKPSPCFVVRMVGDCSAVIRFHVRRTGPADKDVVTAKFRWLDGSSEEDVEPAAGPTVAPAEPRGSGPEVGADTDQPPPGLGAPPDADRLPPNANRPPPKTRWPVPPPQPPPARVSSQPPGPT